MRRMQESAFRRLTLILAVLVAIALPLAAQEKKAAADLTGVWSVEIEIMGNTGNPTWTLEQKGSKLAGTYEGLLGKRPMTGSIEDGKIQLEFEAEFDGNKLKVVYTGTVVSPTSMKGKAQFGDMGEGTWTASRKTAGK